MSESTVAPLSTLDALFGPLMATATGSAWSVASAVVVKGIANEVPPTDIRLWLVSRGTGWRPRGAGEWNAQHGFDVPSESVGSGATDSGGRSPLVELVSKQVLWADLVRSGMKWVELSSSSLSASDDQNRERVRRSHRITAHRLLGGLLQMLPDPEVTDTWEIGRKVNVRVALAGVALPLIDDPDGWDTAILTEPKLAMMAGWSKRTARIQLASLCELRMLRRTRSGRGVNGRFRLMTAAGKGAIDLLSYRASIEALTDGTPDPLADVVRSVTHPAWTHSATLDHRHWLLLLADTAGIPAAHFGFERRVEKKLRGTLGSGPRGDQQGNALHLTVHTVRYLIEILDDIADNVDHGCISEVTGERVSARTAHVLTVQKYAAEATARGTEAVRMKKITTAAYDFVNQIIDRYPIPRSPMGGRRSTREAREKEIVEWQDKVQGAIVGAGLTDPAIAEAVEDAFVSKLLKQGYGLGYAQSSAWDLVNASSKVVRVSSR
jgi:hypothetical protein